MVCKRLGHGGGRAHQIERLLVKRQIPTLTLLVGHWRPGRLVRPVLDGTGQCVRKGSVRPEDTLDRRVNLQFGRYVRIFATCLSVWSKVIVAKNLKSNVPKSRF